MISDSLFYFLDTTEEKDIERVKADNTFLNYELQRVVHLERCLDYPLLVFLQSFNDIDTSMILKLLLLQLIMKTWSQSLLGTQTVTILINVLMIPQIF